MALCASLSMPDAHDSLALLAGRREVAWRPSCFNSAFGFALPGARTPWNGFAPSAPKKVCCACSLKRPYA